MTTTEALRSHTDKMGTAELLTALDILDKGYKHEGDNAISCAISDTLTSRYGLDELVEAIYVEDLDFTGTYTDAIRLAMQAKGVQA